MEITNLRESGDNEIAVQISMNPFGEDGVLTGAEAGARARATIERSIQRLEDDQAVFLDFTDVRAVSVPFVDASIGRLFERPPSRVLRDAPDRDLPGNHRRA